MKPLVVANAKRNVAKSTKKAKNNAKSAQNWKSTKRFYVVRLSTIPNRQDSPWLLAVAAPQQTNQEKSLGWCKLPLGLLRLRS